MYRKPNSVMGFLPILLLFISLGIVHLLDLISKELAIMTTFSYKSALPLLLIILLIGCVSEIDFRTNNFGIPIISGVISNSPSQRILSIRATNDIGEDNIPISAEGALYEDGALAIRLEEIETGSLKLPEEYELSSGPEYYFEIKTADNRVFQTVPQKILPPGRNHSLEWERSTSLTGESSNGTPINVKWVDVYANVEVFSNPDSNKYFRWQGSDTWLFREIPRPFVDTFVVIDSERMLFGGGWTYDTTIVFTPDTAKDCYITNEVEEYPSVILETAGLEPGLARVKIISHELDQTFLFKHYFSVFMHRIDRQAFEYYSKAQSLISNQGTLYDEVPAPLTGNVFDVADPGLTVLGYVELSFPDTLRISIVKEDLGIILDDDCRPRNGPFACNLRRTPGGPPPPPCKCYACDSVYGFDKDIKPDFWE